MKVNKVIVNILVVLMIILISVVSFLGINVIRKNVVTNLIPDYKYGIDLTANRNVRLVVDESQVTKQENGNELEEINEDGTKKEETEEQETIELVNPQEVRTQDNYIKSKEIIEKRLKDLGVEQYTIKLNEETGTMEFELIEDENVTTVIQMISSQAKLEVVDSDSNEVLLTNENIKDAKIGYSSSENGTIVGLIIEFNDDCKDKFKEITENHKVSQDEEGKDTSKKIKLTIDEETLIETAFEKAVEDGKFSMSIGQASNDEKTIQNNMKNARQIAALINFGKTPIKYTTDINRYMTSDFEVESMETVYITVCVVIAIAVVVLFVVNPQLGLKNAILFIGFIAAYLLAMRYTDIIVSLEGIVTFLFVTAMQYLFMFNAAKMAKEDNKNVVTKIVKKNVLRLIPLYVLLIVCIFSKWQGLFSIGVIMFWGLVLILVYNYIFTNLLYENSKK